jgi:predicted acetyltransferase
MSIEIRLTEPHEWRTAADAFRGALASPPQSDDDWAGVDLPASWAGSISVSAWDGARCVGHAAGFRLQSMVPGGAVLPMSGVTRVGVRQTHTRRGILTGLMQRLLREARDEGAVLAGLRASESTIYGRFGFGVAGDACDAEIDCARGARIAAPVAAGSIRYLDRDEMLPTITALHARIGLDRPGALVRPEWMHRRFLHEAMGTEKAAFVIVHTDEHGNDDGWAQFATDWPESFGSYGSGVVCELADLWGATPQVELALWQFLLRLDLVRTVRCEERPVDDAVRWALADPRAYHAKLRWDEQWLRLLDVQAALTARTYQPAPGAVTLAVVDPLFADNNGVWRVVADGAVRLEGGSAADADLAVDVATLSAAYLGGTAWYELAVAGRVSERTPGAVATADALFASRPLPRCGSHY